MLLKFNNLITKLDTKQDNEITSKFLEEMKKLKSEDIPKIEFKSFAWT